MKIYTKTGDDGNTGLQGTLELQNHIHVFLHMVQ